MHGYLYIYMCLLTHEIETKIKLSIFYEHFATNLGSHELIYILHAIVFVRNTKMEFEQLCWEGRDSRYSISNKFLLLEI